MAEAVARRETLRKKRSRETSRGGVAGNRGPSHASPRRFFATSFRDASYPSQMSTYGRCTPEEPNQRAESYDRKRLDVREERRLDEPAVDERVCAVGEPHRDEPAQHPLDGPLQQERAADEAVGGAHESHDGDLAAALQHGHANRGADDDDGHHRERRPDHEPHPRGDLPEPVELFQPIAAEP